MTGTVAGAATDAGTGAEPGPLQTAARRHRTFLVALALAVAVRVLVVIAFPPGFVFSDGPTYLALVDHLEPLSERVSGYGVLLHVLAWVGRGVWLVTALQHLMGLATGVLVYVVLRRWGVRDLVAVLASLPILFDAMELVVEHSVLSDVLFDLLVLAAVAVLAWQRRPGVTHAAVAGLLLGAAVCVRVLGQPTVLAAVLFCLVAVPGLRRKAVVSAALVVAFLLPIGAYATWYHQSRGEFALSQSGGRALYMRTTTFVDCEQITVPSYERDLCPGRPVGQRRDPTYYGWHDPDGNHGLTPPAPITPDQAMHDFAITAIKTQPWDYLKVVTRDIAYNATSVRIDRYDYDTAAKWNFLRYLDLETTAWTRPGYTEHGGELPTVRQPFANLVVAYGGIVYTWGPLLVGMLVLALAGLLLPRPPEAVRTRALIVLTAGLGVGLTIAPDLTAEFVWRYQLPAVMLLPMAAALAWTRLVHTEPAPVDPAGAASLTRRRRRPAPTGRTAG